MTPKTETQESAESATASGETSKGFSDEERAAMKERAQELKAEARKADGESAVLAKITEMPESDRAMAERLHEVIKASAPALSPKTWYGMPAYANKDGVRADGDDLSRGQAPVMFLVNGVFKDPQRKSPLPA